MENKKKDLIALDTGTETEGGFDRYCHLGATSSHRRRRPTVTFDIEKDDEIVCIGDAAGFVPNSSTRSGAKQSIPPKRVTFYDDYDNGEDYENDDIEWIISTKVEPTPQNIGKRASNPDVVAVEDEIGDGDYSLQIEPCDESNVVDVEQEYSSEFHLGCNSKSKCTNFVGCYDVEDDIETVGVDSSFSPPEKSCTVIIDAISPSPTTSVVLHDASVQESEIDEYDARMRACFGLDFSISSVETETSNGESNPNCSDISINDEEMRRSYENEDVIYIEGDSDDDCVVTGMETGTCTENKLDSSLSAVAGIDFEKDEKFKKKPITETVEEIFKRTMPSATPGAISLFAPDRNCLPQNVRPFKFCYYYFVSSHIVVKEIVKQEFYKLKEQILASKKSNAPPRCNCISHPLNQNASKLTLLTNPYSLYHKPNCHFAQNSKSNATRRKGPRRLSYQVSFHRVPQKREGKDFKNWSDIVLRRRRNVSRDGNSVSTNWSCDEKKSADLIQHQPPLLKSELIDSNDIITIKTES